MRKSSLLLLLALFFGGCEKSFDTIIDPKIATAPVGPQQLPFVVKSIPFLQGDIPAKDSTQFLQMKLVNQLLRVRSVQVSIFQSTAGALVPVTTIQLLDDGFAPGGDSTANDSVYSGILRLSVLWPRSEYQAQFHAVDSMGTKYLISAQKFFFLGKNDAPVLSNLSAPDTLTVVDSLAFAVSVKVSDMQGQSDIRSVYMVSYRPDGSTNGFQFPLSDDGVFPDGDANDSIYTSGFKVTSANTKGVYRFEFTSVDRSGATGNVLNHFLLLR